MFNQALFVAVWEQCRIWLYFILFFFILSIGLFVYQAQFVSVEKENLLKRHAKLESQFKAREAKLAETGVPVSTVELIEKNLKDFSELIPGKQQFSDFIGDLFSWAQQSKLDIRQITYQPKIDKKSKFLNYSLNFTVKGNYTNIKKFIHLLENSSRILIVDKIGLTGKKNKDNSSSVSLQINLTTFFREAAK
jgi:type IV pilus assembly protein PilO